MQIRLQKYLADCGIASRRKAEELIKNGRIKVNGKITAEIGVSIDPEKDIVTYKGTVVKNDTAKVYLILNKPVGYVTTVKDQFGRSTIMDLIEDVPERVFPVGRLDYDTSGLVLLTNDGDLTYKLTHPKYEAEKVYIAKVYGMPTKVEMKKFESGLSIEDYKTAPAKIEIVKGSSEISSVKITIREGRNRQIRKMCESIGHKVVSLKRVSIGKLDIGDLAKGKYRKLKKREVDILRQS